MPRTAQVRAGAAEFDATVRIDTPGEADYYRHGGILQYVLRQLLAGRSPHIVAAARRLLGTA